MRECGILMPVSSLPSKYGIGCFSKEAYRFVDFLKMGGHRNWQILPLGPTGFGDSPYQSFSTFAGNPYFIDLEALTGEGLLTREECGAVDFGSDETSVDYEKLYLGRGKILRKAYERFRPNQEYERFQAENAAWLDDYCLFMAIKDRFDGASWELWDRPYRDRDEETMARCREEMGEQIRFYRFQQFLFRKQWDDLHRYASGQGVKIIGDVPIYVAFDSADTWAAPEMFLFDDKRRPLAVAGCPPDSFSADGQLWGNPLYDWDYHKKNSYGWWIRRIEHCFRLYDVLRIDHFRGFDEYYSIPADSVNALNGHWERGPGMDLFRAVKEKIGDVEIIAEDLGYVTDSVRKLVQDSGFACMKVIEFAFDGRDTGSSSDYLPHNYKENCVVYTGTHDNETLVSWFQNISEKEREACRRYLNDFHTPDREIGESLICMAMRSVAKLCVIPIQDYLGLDDRARINKPSTVGMNWRWRIRPDQLNDGLCRRMRMQADTYGRI